jgi:hypothetical protein
MKKSLIAVLCIIALITGLFLISCQKKQETATQTQETTETGGYGEQVKETPGYGEQAPAAGYGQESGGYGEKAEEETGGYGQ